MAVDQQGLSWARVLDVLDANFHFREANKQGGWAYRIQSNGNALEVIPAGEKCRVRVPYAVFGLEEIPAESDSTRCYVVSELGQLLDCIRQFNDHPTLPIERNAMPSTSFQVSSNEPLNQILYGPPGTGKTYETVRAALNIIDPKAVADYDEALDQAVSVEETLHAREALKARFDQLSAEDRIRFVTFHQSFSYEDFVEGLRAESTEGQVQYQVESGVFLRVCKDAVATPESADLEARLVRFIEEVAETPAMLTTATGKLFKVSYRAGNTTLTCEPQSSESEIRLPANIEQVRSELVGRPVENPYCSSYVKGIAAYLRQQMPAMQSSAGSTGGHKPYVLIIDEINRGNISRIFGELITLIEPSKRAGADEALSVTLPYSKKPFYVPDNVYLIGTMNTADRSLAGLDLALRRRFTFTEMPPKPELLDAVEVEGVNIGQMLRVMNQRISVLLDRDHTLGHAYFMPLQDDPTLPRLSAIFRQAILPLLQEYFFENWERIRWVLNDHRKPDSAAFIIEDSELNLSALFGDVHNKLRQTKKWKLNPEAFAKADAYLGIAANLGQVAAVQPIAAEADA
ncbi:McrB family protein [Laribacter hongkongensis]|uniref:McrB family protein n=1 Tax=Laribacter hongkongensis TaxID=168471 RepID=UPI001EFCC9A5|nr:AAA family ATPase [Laribacter hongkongensis]MCG9084278.1 AAA family ATPase [Laribacter hongkongensis]